MRIYEGMFVLDDARSNSNWDGVVREVRGLLERHGSEIFTGERWDERRLAYAIKGRHRAVYLLVRFTAPTGSIGLIKRDCELNDTVLRVLFVRDIDSEKLHKAGLFPPSPEAPAAEPSSPDAAADKPPSPEAPAAEPPSPDAEAPQEQPEETPQE